MPKLFNPQVSIPDKLPAFFELRVQRYCAEKGYDSNKLNLSYNEMLQLSWYELSTEHQTPQALDEAEQLNFDIRRAIGRIYCFVLFANPHNQAYKEFIKCQSLPVLSWESFDKLAHEFQQFTLEEQHALRMTCLLTLKTGVSDVKIKQHVPNIVLEIDSEKFLTQLVTADELTLSVLQKIFPLFRECNSFHLSVLRDAYLGNSHFRNILFTESNNQMLENLIQKQAQHRRAYWFWRWVLNMAAFNVEVGSNLNQSWYDAIQLVNHSIDVVMHDPQISYLNYYLNAWAEKYKNQLTFFTNAEQQWIMHIALFSTRELLNDMQIEQVGCAIKFLQEHQPVTLTEILDVYKQFCDSTVSIAPAYTPAIFSNAWHLLQQPKYAQALAHHSVSPLSAAAILTSYVLKEVYTHSLHQYVSCLECSKSAVLEPFLSAWLAESLKPFTLQLDGNNQLIYTALNIPTLKPA